MLRLCFRGSVGVFGDERLILRGRVCGELSDKEKAEGAEEEEDEEEESTGDQS